MALATLHQCYGIKQTCSTVRTVAGVSLAGDVSIPAESPGLQLEASATTSSSPSPSPLSHTPPVASTLLEAALSPEMGTDSTPHYGSLHHLHTASSFDSGDFPSAQFVLVAACGFFTGVERCCSIFGHCMSGAFHDLQLSPWCNIGA